MASHKPLQCTVVGGAVFGQLLATLTKRYARWVPMKWQLVISCVLFTAFTGGMARPRPDSLARDVIFSIISSMMIGWMEIITLAGAPLMVEPDCIGVATGASYTFRGLWSALGVSIYVTIVSSRYNPSYLLRTDTLKLNNKLTENAGNILTPALVEAGLPATSVVDYITNYMSGNMAGLQSVAGFSLDILAATANAATRVFSNSYSTIYLASLSFGGLSILCALALDGETFNAKLTPEIARRLQNVTGKDTNNEKIMENAQTPK